MATIGSFNETRPGSQNYDTPHGLVVTWADGLGVWHASVPATARYAHDAWLAREAIRDELDAREGYGYAREAIGVRREYVRPSGRIVFEEIVKR